MVHKPKQKISNTTHFSQGSHGLTRTELICTCHLVIFWRSQWQWKPYVEMGASHFVVHLEGPTKSIYHIVQLIDLMRLFNNWSTTLPAIAELGATPAALQSR